MLKQLRNLNRIFWICAWLFFSVAIKAESIQTTNQLFADHTELVGQQIDLLKNRLSQAEYQLTALRGRSEAVAYDQVSTALLKQVGLDIAVAKSNLDSIDIELTEAQQTTARIEKHIQDLENQLNILNVFGLKLAKSISTPNTAALQSEMDYQLNIFDLEKSRLDYLEKLQKADTSVYQLNKERYRRIELMLKSQTIMRLKEEQEKTENDFQRQQTYWLQQLNTLYGQLNHAESAKDGNKSNVTKLESAIFFANENVNFAYLQMLIARYQDQIHQYKISIVHSTSINVLNKISEQIQLLGKQLGRVEDLLNTRIDILEKRKVFVSQTLSDSAKNHTEADSIGNLALQYKAALKTVSDLNQQTALVRTMLDHTLQQELSARQGLPAWGSDAWLELGQQLLWVPTLTYQISKSLFNTVHSAVDDMTKQWVGVLVALEVAWVALFCFLYVYFGRLVAGMDDHESGHINIKWLGIKLLHRNLIDLAVFLNIYVLFFAFDIPPQNYMFLVSLGFVWLLFRAIITTARLVIVESVHDHAGTADVRLYHRLQRILWLGAVITAISVFVSQLPIIYEVKDLFDRIFLLYVFIISIILLRSWDVVPGLILPYIDDRRTYLKRVVRLIGLFIPLILLTNSAAGLLGYVNLVITISWYESVFLFVTVGYLICRGILIEIMERASYILIRHVTNGWLWTEAFLKPIDKVLRITLFLTAWSILFISYGWDEQSPVVERLNTLLHYNLVNVLNTTITPLSVIEVLVIISLLFWAARWTREFVYRFLMSRTKDMGLRNSIAILTQYATIVIGVLIIMRVLGIDFRALTVVAGAFFFGVGLGLRDLFNNFACGFLLLLERPIRVGDIVSVGGIDGDVLHIGGRAVTIRTFDHMELLVPNAEIFSKAFVNWTAKDSIVRTVFSVKINRLDNPHQIQKMIYEVLAANKAVLKDPEPEAFMKDMVEQIEFEVRYYINIRLVKSRTSVRSEILASLWDMFEKHHVQLPYPRHEITLSESNSRGAYFATKDVP